MSRIDVPTLKCDRCGSTTQDKHEMASFRNLTHYNPGGKEEWDLCPECWSKFKLFVSGDR